MSVDFQRLAEVRARHSSRRRRWVRGLALLGAAALAAAASQLAAPLSPGRLLASWLQHGVPLLSRSLSPVDEEARGRVAILEPAAGLIRISSGFLGLLSVDLVVTDDTVIVVGNKEGGFRDIRDGGEVRAAYEVRPGTPRAKRVEVVQER